MESTPEQTAEGMVIVRVLSAVLERLVGANTSLAKNDPGQVTKFHALKPPGISILQYLERIHKYASCSSECFILALIYIDRLIQRNNFLLTDLNVHRVVITGILLAAKFFDDAYYNNAYYAKVGGVLVSEMNSLEVEFLFRINFSLHVTPDVYSKYHAELISHAVGAVGTNSSTPAVSAFNVALALASQAATPVSPQCAPHNVTQVPLSTTKKRSGTCVDGVVTAQITPSPPPHSQRQSPPPTTQFCHSNGAEGPTINYDRVSAAAVAPMTGATATSGQHSIIYQHHQFHYDQPVQCDPSVVHEQHYYSNPTGQHRISLPYSHTVIVENNDVNFIPHGYPIVRSNSATLTSHLPVTTTTCVPTLQGKNHHPAATLVGNVAYPSALLQHTHPTVAAAALVQNNPSARQQLRRLSAPASGQCHYPNHSQSRVVAGCSGV